MMITEQERAHFNAAYELAAAEARFLLEIERQYRLDVERRERRDVREQFVSADVREHALTRDYDLPTDYEPAPAGVYWLLAGLCAAWVVAARLAWWLAGIAGE